MQTEKIILVTTITAAVALVRYRFVDFAGAPAAAGVRVLGVPRVEFDAGEQAGVATHGEIIVEAGAAVAVGDEVQSDASGRAITKAAGIGWGVARDAATAAGDYIRVLR
jgi:hypothetical protein